MNRAFCNFQVRKKEEEKNLMIGNFFFLFVFEIREKRTRRRKLCLDL
jgi:hypothetical protein